MNKKIVADCFRKLIKDGLEMDIDDPNLSDTPERVAKMFCDEFFVNYNQTFTDFKSFPNINKYDQIIMLDRIAFTSTCAHHFLPFTGWAWVLYIPKSKLVGASKMARLVAHCSKRPQLQENLCHDVIQTFVKNVSPEGAMVVIRAVHGCMACRGVKQNNGAGMMTSAVWGSFLDTPTMEQKGLEMIRISINSKDM